MRMQIVSVDSNPTEIADSIMHFLHIDGIVAVEAKGQSAIEQMHQSFLELKGRVDQEGFHLSYHVDAQSPEREQTADGATILRITLAIDQEVMDRKSPAGDEEISEEIRRQFEAWQTLPDEDNALLEKIRQHNAESPILSGGDVDAAWDQSDVGEETVGGSVATPDQDVVDEIGEGAGLIYAEGEALHTAEKLEARDKHRWELDPRSQEEEDDSA